jgi:hypothetical protein
MFHEPLLLIAAYFAFFVLAIIYVRLDFAITKDEGSEAKMKIAGFCEKIISHQVPILLKVTNICITYTVYILVTYV